MLPSRSANGTVLVSLSLHRNLKGSVWYAIGLYERQGVFSVVIRKGKSPAELKMLNVPYSGDNAIHAREAFTEEIRKTSKRVRAVPQSDWAYGFCELDHKSSGRFATKVLGGFPPPWS